MEDGAVYPDNVVPCEPDASKLHSFQFARDEFLFHVVLMRDSLWVWIGQAEDPSLLNISVALNGNVAQVHGNNDTGARIASHIHKRFQQVAYVSYNVSEDPEVARLAERALMDRLAEQYKK